MVAMLRQAARSECLRKLSRPVPPKCLTRRESRSAIPFGSRWPYQASAGRELLPRPKIARDPELDRRHRSCRARPLGEMQHRDGPIEDSRARQRRAQPKPV